MNATAPLAGATAVLAAAALLVAAPTLAQGPAVYQIANVAAPDVLCFYNDACKVTVKDEVSVIPLTGIKGVARFQSRTFAGPGVGKRAFWYRVDLTNAMRTGANVCVQAIRVFGVGTSKEVLTLDYDKNGSAEAIYVVTKGGIGSVGLSGAETIDKFGIHVRFTFSKPVCAADADGLRGESSFFFGLSSTSKQPNVGLADALPSGANPKFTTSFKALTPH